MLFRSNLFVFFFFFKQKTAYEMNPSDWSSDVCSSDLQNGQDYFVSIAPINVRKKTIGHVIFLKNATETFIVAEQQIGRASCRERV